MFTKRWKIGVAAFLCMVLAAGCATVPSASSDTASTSSALSQSAGAAVSSKAPVSSKEAVNSQTPVSSQAAQDENTPCIPELPENIVQPKWTGLSVPFTPSLMRQTVCNFAYIDENGALHFAPSFLKASPTARALEGKRGAQAVAAAYPGVLVLWEDGSVDIAACTSPVQLLKDGADTGLLDNPTVDYGDAKNVTAARAALLDAWAGKKAYAVGACSVALGFNGERYQGMPWMLTTDGDYYIGAELVADGVKYAEGRAVLFRDGRVGYLVPEKTTGTLAALVNERHTLHFIDDAAWTDLVQVQEYQGYVIGLKKDGTTRSVKTELARYEERFLNYSGIIALVPNSAFGVKENGSLVPIYPFGLDHFTLLSVTYDRVVPFWYGKTTFLCLAEDGNNEIIHANTENLQSFTDGAWVQSIDRVKPSNEPLWLVTETARFAPELLVTYENEFNAEEPIPLSIALFAETKDLRWVPREATAVPQSEAEELAVQEALRNATPLDKRMYSDFLKRYTLDRSSVKYGFQILLAYEYWDCESYELTIRHGADGPVHISGTFAFNGTCSFWVDTDEKHAQLDHSYDYELTIKLKNGEEYDYYGTISWTPQYTNVDRVYHKCYSDKPHDVEPLEFIPSHSSEHFTYICDGFRKMYVCEEDSDKAYLQSQYYYRDNNGKVTADDYFENAGGKTLEFTYDPSKNEQTVYVNGVACDFVRADNRITITRDGWITIEATVTESTKGLFLVTEQLVYELTDSTIRFTSPQTNRTEVMCLQRGGTFFRDSYNELFCYDYKEP